jgi:glycosyltransferase involved in cell wall biosynthesis
MKVAIWANSPSIHQRDFYEALRAAGIDLEVRYFGALRRARRDMGWSQPVQLPYGELMLQKLSKPLDTIEDWRERLHVIPGYSRWVNVSIAVQLSRAGVPWVHWSENSQPSWRSLASWSVKKAYAQLVNRYALGAFGHGEAAAEDFVRWGIRREMIAHLHYAVRGAPAGVTPDRIAANFVRGRLAFIFVGTICHNKAALELLRAFAAACGERDDACLIMVGNGPLRGRCEKLIQRLRLTDQVLFRGVAPHAEIGSVMSCCQVAVLPSRYDGWGVVLNEAASAELALIASDGVGAAWHLIEPGVNGFHVRRADVRSLAAAMRAYLNSPELAAEHGRRSAERFRHFLPERNVERFVRAVDSWFRAKSEWNEWRRVIWTADHATSEKAA